jgi:hypothetical protein
MAALTTIKNIVPADIAGAGTNGDQRFNWERSRTAPLAALVVNAA